MDLNQDGINSDLLATDSNFLAASGNPTLLAFRKGLIVDDSQFGIPVAGNALQFQAP